MSPATHTAASAAGQAWDAARYARNAGFVPALGAPLLALLDARPGERILDLGCGDGVLTAQLVQAGADVVGVDASPELVAAAIERGIDARVMDGHALTFEGDFDAVFSNAALHWMRQPDAVLDGVRRALKPGGRFVAEFGGHGNVATIVAAVQAARVAHGHGASTFRWYFPTADAYADRLRQHGFQVQLIECTPRPTALPTGVAGWLRVFAAPLLDDLPAEARATVREAATALLAELPRDASGQPLADYVRLRVLARRR